MRLDLSLVEVFCCVYEEGNISKAAVKLHISQPTVSGHIKNLEMYIGTKLFDRLPRRLAPTRAAQLLYHRGRAILNEKEAAMQDLERFLHRFEGRLVISGSNIPGEYILPQIIADFYMQYPAVKIELRISDAKIVCNDVLSGEAELGFSCARIDTVGLEFRPFASGGLALVVPAYGVWQGVSTITPERLTAEPFLARELGSGMRELVEEKLGRPLEDFNVVATFGSNRAIKEALKAGMGAAVVSLFSVEDEISSGELKTVRIEGLEIGPTDFYTVTNKKLTLSPVAETFLACALEPPRDVVIELSA
ncbi:MAG: LysR substrate-binding domain-containing protein [Pyrinomonadaceae bacterium]